MLTENSVVLDLEGFHYRKNPFFIKELGVCSEEYNDCVLFKPPRTFEYLSIEEKRAFTWLTRNLHGIDWNAGTYPYIYTTQICQSICLRNPTARFYSKGSEKSKLLSELLERPVIDLNDLGCPKTANIRNKTRCPNHFVRQNGECLGNHCAREKSIFYFNWLTNERGVDQAGGTVVSEFNDLCLDNNNGITQRVDKEK